MSASAILTDSITINSQMNTAEGFSKSGMSHLKLLGRTSGQVKRKKAECSDSRVTIARYSTFT